MRNAFLSELNPAEFGTLRTHLAHFEMRAGESLHCFGDMVEDVVFPHSGLVALTMPLHDNPGAAAILIGEGIVGAVPAAALAPAASDAEVHIGGPASRMSAAAFRYIVDQILGGGCRGSSMRCWRTRSRPRSATPITPSRRASAGGCSRSRTAAAAAKSR